MKSEQASGGDGQKYCRECGWVDTERGTHPETGPKDVCPSCGPFGPGLFDDKEALIEYDHESARIRAEEDNELVELLDDLILENIEGGV